jgi:hypothetical protein
MPILNVLANKPVAVTAVMGVMVIALAPLSLHYSLCVAVAWTGFIAIAIDKAHAEWFLAGPLLVAIAPHFIALCIGVAMITYGSSGKSDPGILYTQMYYFVGFILMTLGYLLTRGKVKLPPREMILWGPRLQSFKRIGIALYALWIVDTWVGIFTGAGDRGFAGEFTAENPFGWWSVLRAFRNTFAIGIIVFPLLFETAKTPGRLVLSVTFSLQLIAAFTSGSREFVLLPLVYILIGTYLFSNRLRALQAKIVLFVPLALVAMYVIYLYRSTTGFGEARATAISGRISAAAEIKDVRVPDSEDFVSVTGSHLLDVFDPLVYRDTPDRIPHAGWSEFEAIIWTWVPYVLYRDRPTLIDGSRIVYEYNGIYNDRSFSKISFTADLYRRFGGLGVGIGMTAFGGLLGLVARGLVSLINSRWLVLGVLGFLLIVTYFRTGLDNQTVLTTWWQWAYDIPKNMLFLTLITYAIGGRQIARIYQGQAAQQS